MFGIGLHELLILLVLVFVIVVVPATIAVGFIIFAVRKRRSESSRNHDRNDHGC